MIGRQLLALAMILGTSAMACTALVLGSIGDKDYGVDAGSGSSTSGTSGTSSGTSSSSSSGAPKPGPCSLLVGDTYNASENPPNDCNDCITSECSGEVAIACNEGGKKAEWFPTLARCAQNPWVDYPAPDSGGDFYWGCTTYNNPDAGKIAGDSTQSTERNSQICVRDKCVRTKEHPCRKCEVSHKGIGSDDKLYLLKEDPCGKLFTDHCSEAIVDCCASQVLDDYVSSCANTVVDELLTTCRGIVDAKTDPTKFKNDNRYNEQQMECATRLADCFDENQGSYECVR